MINKRLINMVGDTKSYIVKNVIFQWIALLANIISVFSIAIVINYVAKGILEPVALVCATGIIAAMITVRYLCNIMAGKMSYKASSRVKTILRERVYKKLLQLGCSYRENASTSEVVQVCAEGVEQLEVYFGRYLPQLFYSMVAPVTLFAVLSFISIKAAAALLLCVPLIPMSIIAVQKLAKKLLSRYWGIYTGLGDSFLENMQGMTTLKIFQADEMKNKQMNQEAEQFRKVTMKVLTMQLNSVTLMDLIAFGGAAIGVIIAILEYQAGNIELWQGFVIIMLSSEFFIPLRLLGSFFHIAMNGMAASEKLFRILDAQTELPDSDKLKESINEQGIRFDNISFSYDNSRKILNQVSIEVPKGQLVALVGRSGCGKSTLAALAMGYRKSYTGKITLEGRDIRSINEDRLMREVTYLGHNSYIFKGTVRENLLIADQYASDEMLLEALRRVNLYSFLMKNGGLNMKVNEKGSNLSGGQCQRLALARALLHDSSYYIFDEATSNIDVESEKDIMRVIESLAGSKTILLISHRLAQVVSADRIYLLQEGSVSQQGTHKELMGMKGQYSRMFLKQQELESYGGEENESYA